jgi:ATP-dependent helicase/nuclease subunit A
LSARDEQLGLDFGGTSPRPSPDESPASLPDAGARRRIAEDLDTNLLVEAGAGSGKTTALVSRMVGLVREGAAEVTEIAAVTFTRKAAGELRERFQEALEKERVREGLSSEAGARLERALQNLDRAFMGTIHAFCARLLRERPIEAGIDPGFRETTAPEAARLAARFWGLHLERLASTGDPILGDLEDVGLVPADLRYLYDRLRENLDVEYPLDPAPPPDPAAVAAVRIEVDALLDEAARLMPKEEPHDGWEEAQKRLRSVLYVRAFRPWHDDRVFLDALAELCSRSSWKVIQKRWADDPAGKKAAREVEGRMNRLLDGDAKRLLEEWWAHRYPIVMRFALRAAEDLAKHRRETGHVDFQDLLTLAARLLRERPSAREALGRRWKRILVDEFQDTDPLQAEVLFLLASEPGPGGGGSGDWSGSVPRPGALFVVGDPKQSIYRFRRADIALYTQVRERFRTLGAVVELVANFRSGEPVAALVNAVFAPPAGFPDTAHVAQAAFAPLLPQPRAQPAPSEGVLHYSVRPEVRGRERVARWSASALADWIARRVGLGGDRSPGDFLILTRRKDALEPYARALEARNLPVRVSGAGVGVEEEIGELTLVLEALVDPDDPSRTVAVLVGPFFGLDHEQLLQHREGGLSFDFRLARSTAGRGAVEEALARLRRWWQLGRSDPADVVVGRIASELGLLQWAAAGELGSIRAGALAFVLDAVRAAGLSGDTSLTGALAALETATVDDEAEAPLEPGRSDTIRLMNLHKAKGLEADVVVLAAPYGDWEHPIDRHIERSADGRARGWLAVEQRRSEFSRRVLARPAGWIEKESAERAFEDAEGVRLLYVAATRAAHELVIARNAAQPGKSPWSRFDRWLDAHGQALELAPVDPPERERLETGAVELTAAVHAAAGARAGAATQTFAFESVTQAAKADGSVARAERDAPSAPATRALLVSPPADGASVPEPDRAPVLPVSVHEPDRPPVPPASVPVPDRPPVLPGPGGYEWGSAVHAVLEAAARGASGDRLRAVGRTLLLELDRPVEHGEPAELEALMQTAEGVLSHALWRRAREGEPIAAEVPFALEREGSQPPTYVEGVIDLAFRESDGWVVVDYKTDRGDDPGFAARRTAYHAQLRAYANAWERLTGESVKERLLWFVRSGLVEEVPAAQDSA